MHWLESSTESARTQPVRPFGRPGTVIRYQVGSPVFDVFWESASTYCGRKSDRTCFITAISRASMLGRARTTTWVPDEGSRADDVHLRRARGIGPLRSGAREGHRDQEQRGGRRRQPASDGGRSRHTRFDRIPERGGAPLVRVSRRRFIETAEGLHRAFARRMQSQGKTTKEVTKWTLGRSFGSC